MSNIFKADHVAFASAIALLMAIHPLPAAAQESRDRTHSEDMQQSAEPSAGDERGPSASDSKPSAEGKDSGGGMGMGMDMDKDMDMGRGMGGGMGKGQGMGQGMGMMGPGHMQMMTRMMKEMHDKVMGGGMAMMPKGDQGPASLAFNGINARMHKDMNITYTGRTDLDFAKAMIPHHQAAIDMAKVEAAFGKNPDIRKMAEDMIKTQEAEVATLQRFINDQRD